jgi:replicative DNA helicase
MNQKNSEIRVFFSYSHRDEEYRVQLEEHLAIFRRRGLIQGWSDRKITGGQEWKSQIDDKLRSADLILLLVSPSFIASDYCSDIELSLAISRHEKGEARVVPIFIRPVTFEGAPFAGLQGFPKDAKAVSVWENRDLAWLDVATGIKGVLESITEEKQRPATADSMKTIQDALIESVEDIDRLYNGTGRASLQGISTGLIDLDRLTNGLKNGDLFVIASRPSMGKTTLALNIATTVALQDLPVVVFSTKTRANDVSRRVLCFTGRINYVDAYSGYMRDDDWPRLTYAIQRLSDKHILIDDSPTVSLPDLRARCMREKKTHGALPLVVIDSVQYLHAKDEASQEVENVGRFLKSLARELDTTIIVTSNVSRDVEGRPNKRPVLRDLERNGLADEADVIAFIYIDSFYNPDSHDLGTAELIVAKNHAGLMGTIRLSHFAQYGSFEPYPPPDKVAS